MPRTCQRSDAEILDACRDLAARAVDPTYRSLAVVGVHCCGSRLRRIRDEAVLSGELILPTTTRIRSLRHAVGRKQPLGHSTKHGKSRRPENLPRSAGEFLRIERRFLNWSRKLSQKILDQEERDAPRRLQRTFAFV